MSRPFSSRRRDVVKAIGAAAIAAPWVVTSRAQALTPIKFSLNFRPDASNAAFFLADQRGWYKQAGLDVTFDSSGGSGDVLQRLVSNVYDLGKADINLLTEYVARGNPNPPKSTLIMYVRSPLAIGSMKKAGITKPADLIGKTLGAPQGDGAFKMLPAFAKAANIDVTKLNLKTVDIRLRETLLLRGELDGAFGFDSSIWFNLKAGGAKIEDVAFMYYSDFGLDLYGNSLMASSKILKENPKAVAAFTQVTARAWRDAMVDPKAAVAALKRREPLADEAIELERLQWLIKNQLTSAQTRAEGLGAVDKARFERSIGQVCDALGLANRPSMDAVYDAQFMPPLADRKF
jgi:NitT/TauT family transport system substrate-binding protein